VVTGFVVQSTGSFAPALIIGTPGTRKRMGATSATILRHASSFETLEEVHPQAPTDAVGYAAVMMAGLGSWWAGAVGTDALRLHVSPPSLAAGVAGAVAAAAACIWWTMRGLSRMTERSLLSGRLSGDVRVPAGRRTLRSPLAGAVVFGALGAVLMIGAASGGIDRTGAFFGAGSSLLVSCLSVIAFTLRVPVRRGLDGHGWWSATRNQNVRRSNGAMTVGSIDASPPP
jgi:hypothetical protein